LALKTAFFSGFIYIYNRDCDARIERRKEEKKTIKNYKIIRNKILKIKKKKSILVLFCCVVVSVVVCGWLHNSF
jgi:hypothetical protein